jgi:hypothetical protein
LLVFVLQLACRGLEPSSTDSVINSHEDDGMLKKKKEPTARAKATVLSVMKEMDEQFGPEQLATVIPVGGSRGFSIPRSA